jgi:AbiV family abortive infection protein
VSQKRHKSLTVTEIAHAMTLCLRNARDLVDDASVLSKANRYARSYFLLHTAAEELSKFFILEATGRKVASNLPNNWKRFWQRLRSHDSKMAHLEMRSLIPGRAPSADKVNDAGLELLVEHGLVPRNASLYVDLCPNENFRCPTDIDWLVFASPLAETVADLRMRAERLGKDQTEIEDSLRHPRPHAPLLPSLISVFERVRHLGISEERVRRILEDTYNPKT